MRTDTFLLLPALFIAIYQIKIWKNLSGNEVAAINGKYKLKHFLLFIFAKYSTYSMFIYQLFFDLLKITSMNIAYLYFIGYVFIFLGLFLAISAVKELKDNWDNMMLYKIRPNHKLINTGVYKYIRHPIYLAIILEVVGYEIIANSWLFIFFLVASATILCLHTKNEEDLLLKHFGDDYINYKKQTKKFIPFIY